MITVVLHILIIYVFLHSHYDFCVLNYNVKLAYKPHGGCGEKPFFFMVRLT